MVDGEHIDISDGFNFGTDNFGGGDAFDFDVSDFDFIDDDENARYLKPSVHAVKEKHIIYENALKLAKETTIDKGERIHAVVSGNFIFGDFIEAHIVHHNAKVPKMTISTLSLSQDNVDSLYNLLAGGFVDKLSLIVSAYFYSHEKRGLIPYIYERLDIDDRFQLSVAGIHTKTTTFNTTGGKKIVIHGSANLRSSGNIEQFTIEENPELHDFHDAISDEIAQKYATINHAVRHTKIWESVESAVTKHKSWHQDQKAAEEVAEAGQPHKGDGQAMTHHRQRKARRFNKRK
jgi:hypothetical protein